jgi:hypothetical protein
MGFSDQLSTGHVSNRTIFRWISVSCYAFALFIVHHVHPIAAKAYNDLCTSKGITFGEGYSINELVYALIAIAIPPFIARSNTLITLNSFLGLAVVAGAISLFGTVGNTPFECFSVNGWYEDRTSGLNGFDFWLTVVAFLSYIALVVDLLAWGIRRGRTLWNTRSAKGTI